jgi:predicted nucleic acid-binding protein
MTTTGGEALFLDTNVLIYATDPRSPLQPVAEGALQRNRSSGTALVVSPQVLREYMAVALRPANAGGGASLEDVRANIATFRAVCHVVAETDAVVAQLVDLLPRLPSSRRRIHDANIVATMLAYGVRRLLTHNVADFTPFADLITVIPLEVPPIGPADATA